MTDLSRLRVLIVHDWLVAWAGAERCVEQMLTVLPHADLVVGLRHPQVREHNAVTRQARETWLGRLPGAHRAHRWFAPLEGLAFRWLPTAGYDLVISSSHAFAKAVRATAGGRHVCYCYTPPRYLWDLYEEHRRDATLPQRFALTIGVQPLRWWDRRTADGVDSFISISRHIADRISRCYGRTARVVYPPVTLKPGGPPRTRGGYLLTLGRLVRYKRVDLAIQAAEALRVPLVIAGDGPERARLERLAGPHTTFLGAVDERRAGELLEECAQFVFCAEEDFGIAPIEANAHGAPVVAYRAGGALETLVEGETVEFFDQQSVEAVVGAIERARQRSWDGNRIRGNAGRFAPEVFRQSFREALSSCLEGPGPGWGRHAGPGQHVG